MNVTTHNGTDPKPFHLRVISETCPEGYMNAGPSFLEIITKYPLDLYFSSPIPSIISFFATQLVINHVIEITYFNVLDTVSIEIMSKMPAMVIALSINAYYHNSEDVLDKISRLGLDYNCVRQDILETDIEGRYRIVENVENSDYF